MAVLWLLALVLPALANGESFAVGSCANVLAQTDKLARTEEGRRLVDEVMSRNPSLYLWDPSNTEKTNKAITAKIDLGGGTAEFMFTDRAGGSKTYSGTAEWIETKDSEQVSVKVMFNSGGGVYKEHFGADGNGLSLLYPTYISKHEVIFLACTNVFFGRIFTMYVFTNEDLSSFSDKSCPISVIRDSTSFTTVDPDA